MIEEIIRLERPSTTKSGIDLIANIDKHIPSCLIADHTKIHRILLNLVGNAIKFTAKGCVTISLLLIKDEDTHVSVQFNVNDTGIGIPPEMQDKVFDRFFRVSPSYRGIYTGHGVGLHIAQSYTHLLGGEIELTSEPGVGTSFYFELRLKKSDVQFLHMNLNHTQPIIQSAPTSSPSPSTTMTSLSHTSIPIIAVSNRQPHLLLVEDNPIAMMVLKEIVTASGYNVSFAEDGERAYKLATKTAFDLIITDLGLPYLTGIELTEHLRMFETVEHKKPVPIIGLTAHADDNTKKACIAAGMNDIFSKPMSKDLFEQIKAVYLVKVPISPPTSTSLTKDTSWMELPILKNPMFHLDDFSILDLEKVRLCISNSLLEESLTTLLKEDFQQDLEELEDAHARQDWERITFIAHRGVGTYVTLGLYKLEHAGRYLCDYQRDKRTLLLEPLYQQFIQLIHESIQVLVEREQH